MLLTVAVVLAIGSAPSSAVAYPLGTVTLLAGGSAGYVNATGSLAKFRTPWGVAVGPGGEVYIADAYNHSIRKVTAAGAVTLLAGGAKTIGPEPGWTDGLGANARFNSPSGVAVDSVGNVYVADTGNNAIRKITADGDVITLAGAGPDSPGFVDGTGLEAQFTSPYGIAVDSSGYLYVADTGNHAIRVVSPAGTVTTLAGAGPESPGFAEGTGSQAQFTSPMGVTVSSMGVVYVADAGNNAIRSISSAGAVQTIAGGGPEASGYEDGIGLNATFSSPYGITVDSEQLVYVADSGSNTIRKIAPNGTVSTPAGLGGSSNYVNGTGTVARFNNPQGIAAASAGVLYVGDSGNQRVRKVVVPVVKHTITAVAGANGAVSPAGSSVIHDGDAASYAFTPDEGYHIEDVLVDDVSVGAGATYDFTNVTADHSVTVAYAPNAYTVNATAGSHGSITPEGPQTVIPGDSVSFVIQASVGYHIADVLVDGVSVGAVSTYQFEEVAANHTIEAQFTIDTFNVTPTSTGPGSVTPATRQIVDRGGSLTVTMTPNANAYLVGTVIDDVAVGSGSTYTFSNVSADTTLAAWFAPNPRPGSTRYEQTDAKIGYVGAWLSIKRWFHSAGSYTYARQAGDMAVVRFHGTSIDWITNKDHIYGICSISIDGGTPEEIDLWAVDNTPRGVVWSAEGLSNTDHTVVFRFTGKGNPIADGLPQSAQSLYLVGLDAVDIVGTLLDAKIPVVASCGANGSITPSGSRLVVYGTESPTYTFTPATGYHVEDVLVDGVSVGAVTSYKIDAVTSSHTVHAVFGPDAELMRVEQTDSRLGYVGKWLTLSKPFHSGGSYTYTNTADSRAIVRFEGTQVAWITAKDRQYGIASVRLDGGTWQDVDLFSENTNQAQTRVWISPLLSQGIHTVEILWTGRKNVRSGGTFVGLDAVEVRGELLDSKVTLTPKATGYGTVTPAVAQSLIIGSSSPTFTMDPDWGYLIDDVLLNGSSVGPVAEYRVPEVAQSTSLEAIFVRDPRLESAEQTDTRLSYSGTWTQLARPFHSSGSYAFTGSEGGAVTVKFSGTGVRWVTNMDGLYGIASVSLDGGAPVDVDLYHDLTNRPQTGVWSARNLADGEHTLRIAWTGRKNPKSANTYIGVDRIETIGSLVQAP